TPRRRRCIAPDSLLSLRVGVRVREWASPYNASVRPPESASMGYRSLRECVLDLERHGRLRRIAEEIDPHLEMAEIQRRVYQATGPALYFSRVKCCSFPMVSNLLGTLDRTRFLFRDTIAAVKKLVELKVDPSSFFKRPWRYLGLPATLWCGLPKTVRRA